MGCRQSVEEKSDHSGGISNGLTEEELTHTPPMGDAAMGDTSRESRQHFTAESESILPEEINVMLDMRNQELQIELDALKQAQEELIVEEVNDQTIKLRTQLQFMHERFEGQCHDFHREIDLLQTEIKAMRTELSLTVHQNTKLETTLQQNISEEAFKLIQQQLFAIKANTAAETNNTTADTTVVESQMNVAQIAIQTSMDSVVVNDVFHSMSTTRTHTNTNTNAVTAHAQPTATADASAHAHLSNMSSITNINIVQPPQTQRSFDATATKSSVEDDRTHTKNSSSSNNSKTLTLTSNNKHMIALSFDLQTLVRENKELKRIHSQHKLEKNELEMDWNRKLKLLQKEIKRLESKQESKQRMIDTFEKVHHTKDDQIHILKQQISKHNILSMSTVAAVAGETTTTTTAAATNTNIIHATNVAPDNEEDMRRLSGIDENHMSDEKQQTNHL